MRLRWWGFFVVFGFALVLVSCRKTVAPNTDRNRAPETFLTAAPLDSIGGGGLNKVPYRFHVHWSGSDVDGEVVGFFVAVTETLPSTVPGQVVRLPAPRPGQYKFTTRTDSVFVFDIHEGLGTDREHGLYVFAVDNEGKADATPAFTRFVARDRNLPGIIWENAHATGRIFELQPGGGVLEVPFARDLTDPVDPAGATFLPIDTIPVGAAVYFGWRGFDRDFASTVIGYRYKLFENDYVKVDSTVRSVEYATGVGSATLPLPIGLNVFRVRAVDEAGGTTFPDSVRRFVVNFDPDTWWAGPDPDDPSIQPLLLSDERGRYLLSDDPAQGAPPSVLDPWLGRQRFCTLPADRKPVRTFLEKVRIGTEFRFYIRADGDTVARNADAIYFFGGGNDKDSPYQVTIQPGSPPPDSVACVVGKPGPANGSPVCIRFRIIRQFPSGSRTTPTFSECHPSFNPLIAGYKPETYYTQNLGLAGGFTGGGYTQLRSEDGNAVANNPSGKDNRIRNSLDYMLMYETCQPRCLSDDEKKLRSLVLRFFSNYNPYFLTDVPGFTPRADTLVTDPIFQAHLYMYDPDSTVAGPKAPFLVRVRVLSQQQAEVDSLKPGPNELWQPEQPFLMTSGDVFPISIPTNPEDLPPGRSYFEFELSDFPTSTTSTSLEDRRIVHALFPFYWQTTGP